MSEESYDIDEQIAKARMDAQDQEYERRRENGDFEE